MSVIAIVGPEGKLSSDELAFVKAMFEADPLQEGNMVMLMERSLPGHALSEFNLFIRQQCDLNKVSYVLFFTHWKLGSSATDMAVANVMTASTGAVLFLRLGDTLISKLVGQFKKQQKPVHLVSIPVNPVPF